MVDAVKILVLEDEQNVGLTLVERLRKEGFEVLWATTTQQALSTISRGSFDLALLDVGLPDGSGFDVAEAIRKAQPKTAIIFLTAFSSPEDRIRGLELGAEDYVTKPFHLKELLLRVQNGLKRARFLIEALPTTQESVRIGKAIVLFARFEAEVDGKTQALTHKETALLRLLVESKGTVLSRDEILNKVWSEDEFPTTRTVDNFIMRLRRLVEINPEDPQVIRSVRGVGYQLV
jgi:DNA-binding response OmpR family regulator